MRLIHAMTFVCLLLLLAAIPACLEFTRLLGFHPSTAAGAAAALVIIAGMFTRRA